MSADIHLSGKGLVAVAGAISGSFIAGAIIVAINGAAGDNLCESQAPRVTASTSTNMFNRCTRNLPDGTVLIWDRYAQHQKDLDAGVALKLK